MRIFARRERPHPGAQLTLFEAEDGWRYSLWLTNLPARLRGWRANPDVIDHRGGMSGDHRGLAAWKDKWEHMHDGQQDVSVTIEHTVASGGFSANRYTLRGTHAAA